MRRGSFFKTFLTGQRGFSFVETLLAGALTSAVVLGAATMLNHTAKTEKQTNVQSIIDREFAAGTQLAANVENIRPFLNVAALGNCLTKDGNTNCAAFGNWVDYPTTVPANKPKFQVSVNHLKECAPAEPTCMATRYMRYRWICTAAECSGLETEVRITPINAYAQAFKPRTSSVKLDRRQFLTRDQITFLCGAGTSVHGVDYDQLRADCAAIANSSCTLPQATMNPSAPSANCQDALTVTCGTGYAVTALDNGRTVCRPVFGGRTVAGYSETNGAPYYTPTNAPPTVTNTSVSTTTTTVTTTATSSTPPACDTGTHLLYEYYNPSYGYYYPPTSNETVATGQGFALTGVTIRVFDSDCPGDRQPLLDCRDNNNMAKYMANGASCGAIGSPGGSGQFGYIGTSPNSNGTSTAFLTRYYRLQGYGAIRRSMVGTNTPSPPAGFATEGGQGYLPPQ